MIKVDYRTIIGKSWEEMLSADFVALISNPHFLGDQTIKTQHFVGCGRWIQKSETEITGHHQLRVAHQRYTDESLSTVTIKGHAHGTAIFDFRKVDGGWKFAGLTPNIRWSECDYDKMFGPPPAHQ